MKKLNGIRVKRSKKRAPMQWKTKKKIQHRTTDSIVIDNRGVSIVSLQRFMFKLLILFFFFHFKIVHVNGKSKWIIIIMNYIFWRKFNTIIIANVLHKYIGARSRSTLLYTVKSFQLLNRFFFRSFAGWFFYFFYFFINWIQTI